MKLRAIVILSALGIFASAAWAVDHTFTFTMDEGQEVPPSGSNGSGCCLVELDDVTGAVTVDCTYENLNAASTASHIHAAPAGINGGVILGLTHSSATSGTITGGGTLTAPNVAAMLAGGTYVNLHSGAFPGGEIRGQIVMDPPCQPPIPAMSEWGMLVLLLTTITAGTVVFKSRRALGST